MPRKEYMPPEPKCWIYDAGDGWKIYAGKTDEDNDIISTSFAKANEYWFHINGMPGSHVFLRGPEDESKPSKELIKMAAAVAAWHSKARNGGKCSVDVTQAKCVSKPKGVPAGTVQLSSCNTIRVKPALPHIDAEQK